MRQNRWRIAQVELVGKVECGSPDPIRVLNIGYTYEITDRAYLAALKILGEDTAQRLRWAIQRDEIMPTDTLWTKQLWQVLAEQGWLQEVTA